MTGVDRPLTEPERDLLSEVLMWKIERNIAHDSGVRVTPESVAAALADLTDTHGLHRQYDRHEVWVMVANDPNKVMLTVRRTWLAFHASTFVDTIDESELERALERGDIR